MRSERFARPTNGSDERRGFARHANGSSRGISGYARTALSRLGGIMPPNALYWAGRSLDVDADGSLDEGQRLRHLIPDELARVTVRPRCRATGGLEDPLPEFGVANGIATRYWSAILHDREACLHGFDTFEGLPAQWTRKKPRGYFDQGGELPVIDDDRVEFFKGLFSDTLPEYEVPEHEKLFACLKQSLFVHRIRSHMAERRRPDPTRNDAVLRRVQLRLPRTAPRFRRAVRFDRPDVPTAWGYCGSCRRTVRMRRLK